MQGFDIVQRAETTQKALEARMGFIRERFWGNEGEFEMVLPKNNYYLK